MTNQNHFLFGAATAAHQVEGNNFNNDWWKYEQTPSGKACNSYVLYKEDRKALQKMGCNAYRFSLEWARIEPQPGEFSAEAIQHYHDVIDDLLTHGIEPVVTIHHYTNPVWFEDYGGWADNKCLVDFERYATYVAKEYGHKVKYWITINEPNIYTVSKYISGHWYPYVRNIFVAIKVFHNLIAAHKIAFAALKRANHQSMVSLCMQYIVIAPIKTFSGYQTSCSQKLSAGFPIFTFIRSYTENIWTIWLSISTLGQSCQLISLYRAVSEQYQIWQVTTQCDSYST
jgi:beta-glucosidase